MQAITPVFFTQKKSNYNKLQCNPYDIDKDSLSCISKLPAVYHPPCASWGRLRKFSKFRPGEHWLAVWSIIRLRKYGGILEHPAHSSLWRFMAMPLPGQKADRFGGYSISINQHWFGHKCAKNTFLYIVGCPQKNLPLIPINFDAITHVISTSCRKRAGAYTNNRCTKFERSATPVRLAEWLLLVASLCNQNVKEQ